MGTGIIFLGEIVELYPLNGLKRKRESHVLAPTFLIHISGKQKKKKKRYNKIKVSLLFLLSTVIPLS